MKKKLFALLNISTILLSLFLTGCSGKNSKLTLNNTQSTYIVSNNDNIRPFDIIRLVYSYDFTDNHAVNNIIFIGGNRQSLNPL